MALVYLNGISEKCIWHNTKNVGGKEFVSVSIPYADAKITKGSTGFLSVALEQKQVYPAKNYQTGKPIAGKFNAALGSDKQIRNCTYLGKDGKSHTIQLTNKQIYDMWQSTLTSMKAFAIAKG